MLLFEYTERW